MRSLEPIYTSENISPAWQLDWAITVFWRNAPFTDDWLPFLVPILEQDGIRLLAHQFVNSDRSQFLVSTRPDTRPIDVVRRIKGRLQFQVRDQWPKAFRRNYDLHSIGSTRLEKVEAYVASQLVHHGYQSHDMIQKGLPNCAFFTDENLTSIRNATCPNRDLAPQFANLQWSDPEIDLSQPRFTSHGRFRCNIHLVCVHQQRWRELQAHKWQELRQMIRKASSVKGHLLSRIGLLPEHVHLILGFDLGESPLEIALSYMNNIAFVYGMQNILMPSCFIGSVGTYDLGAISPTAWLSRPNS